MMRRFFILPLSVMMVLASCDRNVVFEKNVKLPDNRWSVNNIVRFTTEITDTVLPHNIYINVRNAGGYQFNNIFIFFETRTPSGKTDRDTVEITLADESGKWKGEGLGDIWDNSSLFKGNFVFPEGGEYTFSLQQAMRFDPLLQIMDVGIRIERSEE
jgi:gliding motility-associated lipoprotein GldH